MTHGNAHQSVGTEGLYAVAAVTSTHPVIRNARTVSRLDPTRLPRAAIGVNVELLIVLAVIATAIIFLPLFALSSGVDDFAAPHRLGRLYARKHGVSVEQGKEIVLESIRAYDQTGEKPLTWNQHKERLGL